MKSNFLRRVFYMAACLMIVFGFNGLSQTTVILQPDSEAGKDVYVSSLNPDINYETHPDVNALAWTVSGDPVVTRSLIEFDLTGIPENATVQIATLSLYNNPTSSNNNGEHSTLSGTNVSWLQRITEPWEESAVTWNNQPASTDENQVIIPESADPNQDYPDIDVKVQIQDMVTDPASNYGFLFRLITEEYYRCLIFASSDNANPDLHPKLTVTYTIPTPNDTCIVLRPDAFEGKDVIVSSLNPDINYETHPDVNALAWTVSGDPVVTRSLIDFDLSFIPEEAILISAKLSLYNNATSSNTNGEHSSLSGSNISLLQRVTGSWDESTVTWNTQPTSTDENQVTIPESTDPHQDYPDIWVTDLIQDMIDNPGSSHGFMYRLQTEEYYRSMIFASSDHVDPALHPKLEICYTIPASVHKIKTDDKFKVYPNPAYEFIHLETELNECFYVEIFNIIGQTVYKKKYDNNSEKINISNLTPGLYIVTISTETIMQSATIIKR